LTFFQKNKSIKKIKKCSNNNSIFVRKKKGKKNEQEEKFRTVLVIDELPLLEVNLLLISMIKF